MEGKCQKVLRVFSRLSIQLPPINTDTCISTSIVQTDKSVCICLSAGLSPLHTDSVLNLFNTDHLNLAIPDHSKFDLTLFGQNKFYLILTQF